MKKTNPPIYLWRTKQKANKSSSPSKSGSSKNIFQIFTKKAISKQGKETKPPSARKNNRKSKHKEDNGEKQIFDNQTVDECNKLLERKTLKVQNEDDGENKYIVNDLNRNQVTNTADDKKGNPPLKLSKAAKSNKGSNNPNNFVFIKNQSPLVQMTNTTESSDSSNSSNSTSDKEEKVTDTNTNGKVNSIDVNNPDNLWYKKQMIKFLKSIPKCGLKNATREVAFQWLNAYLNFLSIRVTNNNFFSSKNDGQTFHAFSEEVLIRIIHQAAALCEKENMLLKLQIPKNEKEIIVMSDVHGSLADIFRAFIVYGLPGDKTYLFLGDYVDRGEYEVEIVILLFILKICFPYSIFLLRGNHEFPDQNRKYDFPKNCKKQFSSANYWKILNFAFNRLSLAAIIEDQIYCSHGGVSQWLKGRHTIEKLVKPLDQNKTLIERLIITDTVWSDTIRTEKQKQKFLFSPTMRGIGYAYSEKGLKEVLNLLKIKKVIRGHHPHNDGFYEDYENICYTVHARQIEHGSKGSICKIYKDHKTSKVILEALNYQINLFFEDHINIGYAIDDIRKEYLIRQKEFLNQDQSKNVNEQKIANISYKLNSVNSTQDNEKIKECFYCNNFKILMKECCSRNRIFVTHLQIFTFMMKYKYLKRTGYQSLLKSTTPELNFKYCVEEFPSFIDFIHSNFQRHPSLITPKEIKIIQRLNEGICRYEPRVTKTNDIRYNVLPNQMYYENSAEDDEENIVSPFCSLEADKQKEDNEHKEIKLLCRTLEDDE
uniref:Serine/threonine-protein phosphatase n=1 Tax=Strongyloides papillosus TaxID=174720 RepID=A0A0N5BN71_STREA